MKALSLTILQRQEFDDTIDRILSRPEYSHLNSSYEDFFDRIRSAISEWLIRILERTFSGVDSTVQLSENLSTIFMIIGILVILAIIIIIFLKFTKTVERNRRISEILGEKISAKTTPDSLRLKSSSFKNEGNLRLAIRYDFIALLLLMHEKRVIYLEDTKTNEEIYGHLKKHGFPVLDSFKELVNTFNSSWYGHKISEGQYFNKWNNDIDVLWNEVMSYETENK